MKGLKDYFNTSTKRSDDAKTPAKSDENATNTSQCQEQTSKKSIENSKKPTTKCHKSMARQKEQTETLNKTPEVLLSPETPTVNAFQFLMNSRNKIIGTNSPGKELSDKEKSPSEVNKETLKARKRLLQGWSDTKAASKRKLEDEEIDKCIKVKLDVRKKRFKTLLNVDGTDDENSKDGNMKTSQVNRNSSDEFECTSQEEDAKRSRKKKHQRKKENINLTPSKSWKMKIKLVDEGDKVEENVTVESENDESVPESTKSRKKNAQEIDKKVIIIDDSPNSSEENRRVLRNRTSLQKPKHYADYSDEDSDEQEKQKKLKVAPVFTKSVPKPKEDPEVVEARRKFLMSEIPDVLKKRIEKQESITVPDFDVFPKISHVRQEDNDSFWNLPEATLKITEALDYNLEEENCEKLIDRSETGKLQYEDLKPLTNVKTIVKNLKLENPAYPVYRTYRILKEKHSKSEENTMWTERYKPTSTEDVMGNSQAVSTLKNWLESWNEMLSSSRKRSNISSDSESDFQSSDAESCCSLNTGVVLIGPCGSGKSSTVYALCNELGFDVIELNASSRRTGKQVLQELQEATQSHQVRKNKEIFQVKKSKKMCVLLIEDIDLVFEQDDGFIAAISQISTTTKRPIILTTTDKTSPHTQKFTNDFKTLKFRRISTVNLSIWAQILCLLEGIFVDNGAISEMFERNNGDVRKTLLELQLWVESGGQINNKKNSINAISHVKTSSDVVEVEDDEVLLKEFAGKSENYRTHLNVVLDFETFENNVPILPDLRKIWWNFPMFLNAKTSKNPRRNREKLEIISRTYDNLAICDVAYRKMGYKCDVGIAGKRWDFQLRDSLKIDETDAEFSSNYDFFKEWNHSLLDKSLEVCQERFVSPRNQRLNMGFPDFLQQSESSKNHRYEEELMQAVPLSSHLDRKSVSLDYLPALRNIARLEKKRAENNSKRNNRFYNYLQNFNVNCGNNALMDFASNTFSKKN